LISPVCFSGGAICPKLSDRQIDTGTKVWTGFKIDTIENKFEGALLFKLGKHVKSDDRRNTVTSTAEINEATHVHMIVAWKVKNAKPFAYIALVEHTKEFIWSEDKLKKLYNKNHGWLKEYDDTISETWFMDSNMVLKTSFSSSKLKGIFELSISISEGEKSDHTMRPFCIDFER
jgi:hypothetical protein